LNTATKYRRTRLQPEERRAQLLGCALTVFADQGIGRATHSQVAESAGVSVPAVYSYFRTRDDLVSATLREVESYLDRIVATTLEGRQCPYEALISLAQTFAGDAKTNPKIIKVWLDWSTGVELDAWSRYLETLERLHHAAGKTLARGKREGLVPSNINVKAAARIYIGGGHTIALMQFAGIPKRELDIFIKQMVRGAMGIAADAFPTKN
jgi:TetR/AcrR family transcriptional regulator, hemagglutinin/protease regulatory protein